LYIQLHQAHPSLTNIAGHLRPGLNLEPRRRPAPARSSVQHPTSSYHWDLNLT
jgi:hypothetical protein